MVLAEIQADFSYKIIARHKDVTRLGDETFKTGMLSAQAIAKGVETIRGFGALARNRGFTRIEAVATSAVREAANGGALIEAIQQHLTHRLEEARVQAEREQAQRDTKVAALYGGHPHGRRS